MVLQAWNVLHGTFPGGLGGENLKLMLTQSSCAGAGTELGHKYKGYKQGKIWYNYIFLFLSTAICDICLFIYYLEKQKGYCQAQFQFASSVKNLVCLPSDYYQPPKPTSTPRIVWNKLFLILPSSASTSTPTQTLAEVSLILQFIFPPTHPPDQ